MNTTPRSCWSGAARPFHPFGRGLFMLLSALLLAVPVSALAAPGDLDPSFDGDGLVLTDFGISLGTFEEVNALAIQPDGKLVAAGRMFPGIEIALARYNDDGSLDRSFGDDGRVVNVIASGVVTLSALAVQPDGKVVAAIDALFTITVY